MMMQTQMGGRWKRTIDQIMQGLKSRCNPDALKGPGRGIVRLHMSGLTWRCLNLLAYKLIEEEVHVQIEGSLFP